jgi:glycosyltransferase involved in cell wall biosynthesis
LKWIEKNIDVFIAPSRFCEQKHRQMGFAAPIVHLHSFVPPPDKAPGSPVPDNTRETARPYFLFVGRLEKIKGLQTIIPLFQRDSRAGLWIAGTGDYECRLKRLAGASSNIRFLGYQQGQALHSLYQGAVAVIVPSLCLEIAPSVIPEAFMHRTPVIARRRAGMQEMIEESGGGLLFETEEELMHAVSRLVEDPPYRDKLGEDGHQAYLRNWTKEVHLKRYFTLIENVADSAGRGEARLRGQ